MRAILFIVFGVITSVPALAAGEPSLLYGFTDLATNLAALVLVIFLVIVWKMGGFVGAANALDERAKAIENELEHARSLREAATESFSKAQRRQEKANKEAEQILERAKKQADAIMVQARKDMDDSLARKEAQLESRIARAEAEAIADIKNRAIETAGLVVTNILEAQSKDIQLDASLKALKDRPTSH